MNRERHTINRLVSSKPRKFMGKQAGYRIGQWRNEGKPTTPTTPGRVASSASDAIRVKQRQAYEAMPEGFKRGGK